eukprot:4990415-Amphidinium_carterae.1
MNRGGMVVAPPRTRGRSEWTLVYHWSSAGSKIIVRSSFVFGNPPSWQPLCEFAADSCGFARLHAAQSCSITEQAPVTGNVCL